MAGIKHHAVDPWEQIRSLADDARRQCDQITELCHQIINNTEETEGSVVDELTNSVDFLRRVIDAAPMLAIELVPEVYDPQIIFATTALERLFEYAPGELIGELLSTLAPPDKRAVHQTHIASFMRHPVDRQMGTSAFIPEGWKKSGLRFPVSVAWSEFYVKQRHCLAVSVMPQLMSAASDSPIH